MNAHYFSSWINAPSSSRFVSNVSRIQWLFVLVSQRWENLFFISLNNFSLSLESTSINDKFFENMMNSCSSLSLYNKTSQHRPRPISYLLTCVRFFLFHKNNQKWTLTTEFHSKLVRNPNTFLQQCRIPYFFHFTRVMVTIKGNKWVSECKKEIYSRHNDEKLVKRTRKKSLWIAHLLHRRTQHWQFSFDLILFFNGLYLYSVWEFERRHVRIRGEVV